MDTVEIVFDYVFRWILAPPLWIFFIIIFLYILDHLANFALAPFALIHKSVLYIAFIYEMYLLAQFFKMFTVLFVDLYRTSAFTFLILFSVMIFFMFFGERAEQHHEKISKRFQSLFETCFSEHFCERLKVIEASKKTSCYKVIAFCAIPTLWLIYYLDINFLNQPLLWFFICMKFLHETFSTPDY